jgi:predicted lipoprotein with Yx(FWY)xxD motif
MNSMLEAVVVVSVIALSTFEAVGAASEPAKMGDTTKGRAWIDAKGMTLYTFEKDFVGKSNCNDKCATAWPPFQSAGDGPAAGDWTLISRNDGSRQWAYKGKPLYLQAKDNKPGDATGDGVNGFHLAT